MTSDTRRPIRVGIIDSGINSRQAKLVAASVNFTADQNSNSVADKLGHGEALAEIILTTADTSEVHVARVFDDRLTCSATRVSEAIFWLCEQQVDLISMSFGLRQDRNILREACALASDKQILLLASSPARGEPVFPASYRGVIRVTGDARCQPGQYAFLNSRQADFGTHVRSLDGKLAGASFACARFAVTLINVLHLNPGISRRKLLESLANSASFYGPENKH